MVVNGHEIQKAAIVDMWRENKIYVDQAHLKDEGLNVIEFAVENQFNNDQFGFLLGKDPSGEEYMYIQTVPYYASRIVPMFDQPNIKGRFTMAVVHSAHDTCVTTGILQRLVPVSQFVQEDARDWLSENVKAFLVEDPEAQISVFDNSPYLSSYLLNLVCGPLSSIDAAAEQCYNGIQMKIMCRSRQV